MKQRLGIAAALLGDPALLVLDEPTNGLDPAGINEMRDFIRSVGDGKRTVLVSSHILSELEQVCDWLIVIDRGSLVYQGPTQGFLGQADTVVVLAPEHLGDLDRLAELARADGHDVHSEAEELIVPVGGDEPRKVALALNKAAIAGDIVLADLHVRRPSLESNYLAVVEERER
jgi:ABC-2 type transport system ATP-binding protein